MRKAVVCTFAILLLSGLTVMTLADFYATKADYRIGKLTPGGPSADRTGTDDCVAPTQLLYDGFSPINDTGDTSSATSLIDTIPLSCNGNYTSVAGPDHIYAFSVSAACPNHGVSFQISTTDTDYDPSIYILSSCGDGSTCVNGAASDNCFAVSTPGNPCANSTEAFGPVSFAPGTYFFVVDSFYAPGDPNNHDSGPYELDISGYCPAELIEFSVD